MRQVPAMRVGRRHVFFLAGFDPMPVEGHLRIFQRELKRFAAVWGVATRCLDETPVPTPTGAMWRVEAAGPNWETAARFELLAWDDLARADMARPLAAHLKGTVRALADMIRTGTILSYFRTSRRYGIFFLLTYLLLAAFWSMAAALAYAAGQMAAPHTGSVGAFAVGLVVMLAAGLLLMRWPGRRFRLKQSLDLAEFSVDFVRGRHPEVDARIVAFADRLRQVEHAAAAQGVEEIVICAHSLGAQHAVSAVARALADDPDFGTRVPVRILTLGSTTAKFALHPAGARLRAAAAQVAAARQIGWLEIQSRDDIVSFYKVNPVTLERAVYASPHIPMGDYTARPLLRHVQVCDMLSGATFRRFRLDVMRVHCQCFLANDIRAPHDFYAYVCGPLAFDVLAAHAEALRAYTTPDGTLLPLAMDDGGRVHPLPATASHP